MELRLDFLPHPPHHLLGFATPGLGAPRTGLTAAPPNRVLRERRPQFLEVGWREALTAEGVGPLIGQAVDEPVALRGQAASFTDEVGEPRRHAISSSIPGRTRTGSPRSVRWTRMDTRAWA